MTTASNTSTPISRAKFPSSKLSCCRTYGANNQQNKNFNTSPLPITSDHLIFACDPPNWDNFWQFWKDSPGDLWHLRHWLQFWQLRTWMHDNLWYLTINCDTGQHLQSLRCFFDFLQLWVWAWWQSWLASWPHVCAGSGPKSMAGTQLDDRIICPQIHHRS